MNPREAFPIGSPVRTPYGLGLVQGWMNVGFTGWRARVALTDATFGEFDVAEIRPVDVEAELTHALDRLPPAGTPPRPGRPVHCRIPGLRVIDGGRPLAATADLDART